MGFSVSGRQDLNLRPLGPQPSALPDYATSRLIKILKLGVNTTKHNGKL